MAMKKNMKIKREAPEAAAPTKKERKESAKAKMSKTGKIILVAIGVAAMLLSVTAMACSGVLNQVNNKQDYTLTGGVAATVNGTNIKEDTVTERIMSARTSGGYSEDKDWAQNLVDQGMTPESYRESIIQGIARDFLLMQAISEYGITVSDDEVNEEFDLAAESYGGKDAMMDMLSQLGYDEQTYKESIRSGLEQEKLREEVAGSKEPADKEILAYFNENLDTYNDARRSSNLLVKVDADASKEEKAKAKKKAQEALDKIESGKMTFEEAVEEYSDDAASKVDKGDVGWDKLTSFVTEYQDALSKLKKGEMSGLVKTTYGYHIILCTDTFKVDGKAKKIDQLPAEVQDYISNVVKTQTEESNYNAWLDEYTEKADIKVNEMPEAVPYNVDLEGVKPTDPAEDSDSKK